ncbi:1,4-beta-xylanase [Microbacterium mangrovi]|uniref:Beta-xylanase n=1 Tax=Microbacterium mangrovi TaxID=1348253 RepID=A0A0B2A214_9MICO|nr:endo-1,4-beta-xylanase [Microbacterium mangrovi]KHK97091.1 1,4-beta-xylanase [Microbacterium mangrovi]
MRFRNPLIGAGIAGLAAVLTLGPAAAHAAPKDGTNGAPSATGSVPSDSLRALAARSGLRIGTAVNTDLLGTDATYTAITDQQFSTVTPENVMKWQLVEPTRGTYDWAAADRLVASARANGQLVRGHTLVWHSQLPDWLVQAAPAMSADELRAVLKKHVTDEVTHFKGKIWQWDVVNEAFNDDGTLRDSIFLQKLGPGYIADAFRWAHAADPKAQLFYNDYNIEYTGPKSNAVYALVTQLKAEGVPIDGVGFQTHLDTQYPLPDLRANLQRFADLGLNVAETEVDVRTTLPVTAVEQSAQVAAYSQTLQACLAVRSCISYTVWGFDDGHSWVPGVFAGEGAANLYDAGYTPKAQYFALQQDLATTGAPHRTGSGAGAR